MPPPPLPNLSSGPLQASFRAGIQSADPTTPDLAAVVQDPVEEYYENTPTGKK